MASLVPARVLIVTTSHSQLGDIKKPTGAYLSEVTHVLEVLKKEKIEFDIVSIGGGKIPLDGVKLEDPINKAWMENAEFKKVIESSPAFDEKKASSYRAIYLPGGHGTMWDLPSHAGLQSAIAKIYEQGGVVSALCHGPAGLVNVKLSNGKYLVAGKKVAAFTNEEEKAAELEKVVPFLLESRLRERGATIVRAKPFEKQVIVSDRLITGQNPASATELAQKLVQAVRALN